MAHATCFMLRSARGALRNATFGLLRSACCVPQGSEPLKSRVLVFLRNVALCNVALRRPRCGVLRSERYVRNATRRTQPTACCIRNASMGVLRSACSDRIVACRSAGRAPGACARAGGGGKAPNSRNGRCGDLSGAGFGRWVAGVWGCAGRWRRPGASGAIRGGARMRAYRQTWLGRATAGLAHNLLVADNCLVGVNRVCCGGFQPWLWRGVGGWWRMGRTHRLRRCGRRFSWWGLGVCDGF